MGNIYGVASPLALPQAYQTVGAADVTLAAGVETAFITTPAIAALNNGDYYPLILGMVTVVLGVAAPTALVFAFKLGAGSDVMTYTVEPGLLVNSAELVIPLVLVGLSSSTAWIGPGSIVNITGLATGQDVTAKFVGTSAIIALFRGPDA